MRFGTIGTSAICERFCAAMAQVGDVSYRLAYSRDSARAEGFARRNGGIGWCSSLDELAASAVVDAVYVSSPNGLHAQQAIQLLEAGKHVLVEKSFAANAAEAREVFSVAHERGLVAMEAMRNIHTPGFKRVERAVAEELGQVRAASLGFSKVTSRMARLRAGERLNLLDPRLAGGATMDMGVYVVEPAVALFGRPRRVAAMGLMGDVPGEEAESPYARVDLAAQVLLEYGDHVAHLSYGKLSDWVAPCQVEGEEATLTWQSASAPHGLMLHRHEGTGMVYNVAEGGGVELPAECAENDMVYELRDFVRAVGEGPDGPLATRYEQVTLESLAVQDEVRRQLGVRFPAD